MVIIFKGFNLGCHGIPERCFIIRGKHMPFCARCLGASIGHIWSFMNFLLFPMLPIIFASMGLVIIYVDWYLQNKVKAYHSNSSRLITGIIGGYCVGVIIWTVVGKIIACLS
jgi:uncharacterized membrane protein